MLRLNDQKRRQGMPLVQIGLDVFCPNDLRAVIITAPWFRK